MIRKIHAVALAVATGLLVFGIEEWRHAKERGEAVAPPVAARTERVRSDDFQRPRPDRPDRPVARSEVRDQAGQEEADDRTRMTDHVRELRENPAARAMMAQGIQMAVSMMYDDFIGPLELSDEEAEHLRGILGAGLSEQQEIGMEMMGADEARRNELTERLAELEVENQEAVRVFLNHDDDFRAYEDYRERIPDRQQLGAIREVMKAEQLTIDESQEEQLVEVLHRARNGAGMPRLEGAEALQALSEGTALDRFESGYGKEEAYLRENLDFLSEAQREAFFGYREQMREFQRTGLRMADEMMQGGD